MSGRVMSAALLLMLVSLFAFVVPSTASGHREHKVHNIVLYPDKQSWCKTTAIRQVVAMPGHVPVTIDNHVCVGACFSYSIPSSEPAEPGELIRPYCDSCQPVQTRCYHVTLQKEAATAGDDTSDAQDKVEHLASLGQKRVQIIDECACLKCGGGGDTAASDCDASEQRTSELPEQLRGGSGGGSEINEDSSAAIDVPATVTDTLPVSLSLESAAAAHDLLAEDGESDGETDIDADSETDDGPLRELLLARHRHWGLGVGTDGHASSGLSAGNALGEGHEGRLARGPHGSLVLVPQRLTVDEREMRPAHEGTVIAYHEHHQHHQADEPTGEAPSKTATGN